MAEQRTVDRSGWWLVAGLLGQLLACYAVVYKVSGRIMLGDGFKGIFAGTVGSLFALLLLVAGVTVTTEKSTAAVRARIRLGGSVALLAAVAAFGWFVTLPVLRHDPSTYYYGSATATYDVTYSSGKTEQRSGASLGEEKWDWAVALRLSATLALGAAALFLIGGALRDRREGRVH